jgi:hypothetical protein
VAAFAPVVIGLNVTVIAQLAPVASEVPQLFVCANSLGCVPPMTIDVIAKAVSPVLRSMIVCAVEARFSA